ncbi:RHS repeat domain-containing protein [Sphingomonas hengshuiensis]|uniref:RHS repeat domain-containing protein n=1 Tax=Sphingomonas hengshuiensis TaxID=1609977 RepID=UPI00138DEB20|nr:RHS repeat-associated core domain-containing protein [Sphingomonas hengshuiensis]
MSKDEKRDSAANVLEVTNLEYCTSGESSCPAGLLKKVSSAEGNGAVFKYDARGNTIETRVTGKTGTNWSDIVSSATYPAACDQTNAKTCNKPVSTTDPRQAVTLYDWNTANGQLNSVTYPAVNGVSPQIRYGYSNQQAYDAAAQPIDLPISVLTTVSGCRTLSSCANTADEARSTISYASPGTPNNVLPVSVIRAGGDGSGSATKYFTYDSNGNVASEDGPLPGSVDVSRMAYDVNRRLIATMGADPDGSGPRKPVAQRFTYAGDGQVALAETGNLPSEATDWSSFSSLQSVQTTYDPYRRKIGDTVIAGGTAQSVTQYKYDAVGRPLCAAVRMDPNQWAGQSDACVAQTSGGNGPDRVTLIAYDGAGRLVSAISGYGTTAAATESMSYTSNGQIATVTDAKGNVTAYSYDPFDRLNRQCFQTTSSAACAASTADFEEVGHDPNGNVTWRRLRDGTTILTGYDLLNRLISKDTPNTAPYEYDVSYAYDLQGNLTQALDTNGHVANFTYDALGRKTVESSNWTTRSWQYDVAGRRSRLTWNDGFYVTYDYDNAGLLSAIRENGGTTLAGFGYNDLGLRSSLTRSNGTSTSYVYDPASRLHSLTNDLSGSSFDQSYGFEYNPAGQITSRTSSNPVYAFNDYLNVNRGYASNGLNQYTNAGATSLGYDARGNLTQSGSSAFGYTSENHLATAPGGYVVTHDPLGRFHWVSNTGTGLLTWMQYDGDHIIEERNGAGVVRRYVFGPGDDEPIVWYEGPGTSDRRFLYADERGSIVAVADNSGNKIATNSYDEFGIPQAGGNTGRFQYTGQVWLPELGMYHYKARTYSPTLGRFLQADPIGYGDGLNKYAYVGNDAINRIDPSGTCSFFQALVIRPHSTQDAVETSEGIVVTAPAYDCLDMNFLLTNAFRSLLQGGSGSNGDPNHKPATVWLPQAIESLYCRATGLLGSNGRLRLGADFGLGWELFEKGGVGLSIRGDGSLEFDSYVGVGFGYGAYGGAGLSLDNQGAANAPGWSGTAGIELSGAVAVPSGLAGLGLGGYGSVPINQNGPGFGAPSGGGGVGVGPRYGAYLAETGTGTLYHRSESPCK